MTLWNQESKLNPKVEAFCVGDDFVLDKELLAFDIEVNLAHGKMLVSMGVLTSEEFSRIENALKEIDQASFEILPGQEDVHTAVEEFLVKKLGAIGKKIHTGKSRNDQVAADLALLSIAKLQKVAGAVEKLIDVLQGKAKEFSSVPMPGYTHMQKAMPYSVSSWLLSFVELLGEDLQGVEHAFSLVDKNALGSAAGYGVPLTLDVRLTTKELGFAKSFSETLSVQNSRGKKELVVLGSLNQLMLTLNKLASDLMLFTTSEFGFFSLPDDFCTGSSIMPQKKNYDVFELVRGKSAGFAGKLVEVNSIVTGLMSGYNRDFQLLKGPLLKGFSVTLDCVDVMAECVKHLQVEKANLQKAMTSELYATQKALEKVSQGKPFREAYVEVSQSITKGGE